MDQGFRIENIQIHFQEDTADGGFRDANQTHDDGPGQHWRDENNSRYPSSKEETAGYTENEVTSADGRVNIVV